MHPVLHMPGLRVCQPCERARARQGIEFAWESLNMP